MKRIQAVFYAALCLAIYWHEALIDLWRNLPWPQIEGAAWSIAFLTILFALGCVLGAAVMALLKRR